MWIRRERDEAVGGGMSACNFEYLLQLINKQLDLDKQIEVYGHLERCDICRDAVHQISRDMDGLYAGRRHIDAAGPGRTQMSATTPLRTAMRRSFNRQ
jgi:hypothetical protein